MTATRETQRAASAAGLVLGAQRPTRVRLRVWGFTRDDAAHAELIARRMPGAAFWDVVEVIPSSGGACPIPSGDPIALNQGADYDRAWAVYLAGSDAR